MIGNIVKNGKFMDQGIKNIWVLWFSDILKRGGKKQRIAKCVQYATTCMKGNIYIYIINMERCIHISNSSWKPKKLVISWLWGREWENWEMGRKKLTFPSTPLCTVLFFYMYMSSPTKIIFNSWPLFLTSSLTTCVILCYHLPQFSPF